MPFSGSKEFHCCRIDFFALFFGLLPDTGSNTEQPAATGSSQKHEKYPIVPSPTKPKGGTGGTGRQNKK
jgi:hypothetical protein